MNLRGDGPNSRFRISVVIPSWRDAENLEALLPALAAQDRVAETIVVDASGDAIAEQIALGSGATFIACATPNRRHPRLMWLESVARFLARHGGTLYGDQSIFVRREVFERLGGFAKIPLMEDVEFSKRLRGAGKIAVLDPPVASSGRRHLRKGAWRTTIQNGLFILLYHLGVSPHRLHRW